MILNIKNSLATFCFCSKGVFVFMLDKLFFASVTFDPSREEYMHLLAEFIVGH